ncbi:MAG TPA: glycosyltransferase family 9 protein, partial [Thermoanaerobaculia bacterium]|nr:glycosyltransferase family 9 protein [Thermoanaerobaculia bacterium]
PRPVLHVLEYAGLLRLLEGLRERRPGLPLHLLFRSALADPEPFRRLPADSVARLPPEAAADLPAELLDDLRRPGTACLLVGAEPAEAEPAARLPGVALAGTAPLGFRLPYPESPASRRAGDAFFAAAAAASPRWLLPASGPPPPFTRRRPRVLVHQSRFHVGDALWLVPLLRALRRHLRDVRITVAGSPALDRVLAGRPYLDELWIFDPSNEADRERIRRRLAARGFDAALFAFARRPKSRWLAEAAAEAGVPHRVNLEYFDAADDGRRPSGLFTAEGWFFWGTMASPRLLLHALLPLLGRPGAPPPLAPDENLRIEYPAPPAARGEAGRILAEAGLADGLFAVLAPGGLSSERWPAARFAELAVRLGRELGLPAIVEGGPGEEGLLDEVAREIGARPGGGPGPPRPPLVRRDPLPVLAALLERAALLVGNDSAPIHLAEAAGTPTLYLAHHEKLVHSHPAGGRALALFDDLSNRVANVSVEQALEAARFLLGRG